jgi:hypothetical protein
VKSHPHVELVAAQSREGAKAEKIAFDFGAQPAGTSVKEILVLKELTVIHEMPLIFNKNGRGCWDRKLVSMIFSLMFSVAAVRAQVTNNIYHDIFSRSGALNGSTPSPVDTSSAKWNAWPQLITAGSAIAVTNASPSGGFNNAFLPFTPSVGHIYTLSINIYGTSGGSWWLAFGFAQSATMNDYYAAGNSGVGWLLQRADNSQVQVFDGPGTAGVNSYSNSGNAVTNSYSIVLDTTVGTASSGWTIAYLENGTLLRQDTYSSNPSIQYVGIGAANATGRYLNFQLTDASFNQPIFIQKPPASIAVNENGRLTIAATVAGATPLNYAWTNLSTVPPTLIGGQTNATLILTNVSYAAYNNAQIQLTVTNQYGVTNATTLVTVNTNLNPVVILDSAAKTVTMADGGSNLVLRLNFNESCYLDRVVVRGREVVAPDTGVCSAVNVAGNWTTTRSGIASPTVTVNGNQVLVSGIAYTAGGIAVQEQWTFNIASNQIGWQIIRNYLNGGTIDDTYFPGWDFNSINIWTGGLLDTGGVAWSRFLTSGSSYGEHLRGSHVFRSSR